MHVPLPCLLYDCWAIVRLTDTSGFVGHYSEYSYTKLLITCDKTENVYHVVCVWPLIRGPDFWYFSAHFDTGCQANNYQRYMYAFAHGTQFIKLTLHWDTLETRFIEPVNWFLTQLCLRIVQRPRRSGIIFVFDLYFNTYTPKAWLKWSRVGWLIWRDGLSPISNGCRFVTINSGIRLLLFNMYLSISVRLTGCSDSQFRCIT